MRTLLRDVCAHYAKPGEVIVTVKGMQRKRQPTTKKAKRKLANKCWPKARAAKQRKSQRKVSSKHLTKQTLVLACMLH